MLAAAEYARGKGREFLTALAVAYQVQCRLSDVAPVRTRGFDHTTQGSFAVAAGVSQALGLDQRRTANAIAISGTAFNALRVTRTGALSHWKGLAYPNTSCCCTHAAFLAMRGITGPPEVFEGNKGFMQAIAGEFHIDWSAENLEHTTRTIVKKYNAEIHSQSAIEGILELKREYGFRAEDVGQIELETFDVAYNIIGGGEEGNRRMVRSKEEADHSLPYILAVALIDSQVMPPQYQPERIALSDVQALLQRITVRPAEDLSRRVPISSWFPRCQNADTRAAQSGCGVSFRKIDMEQNPPDRRSQHCCHAPPLASFSACDDQPRPWRNSEYRVGSWICGHAQCSCLHCVEALRASIYRVSARSTCRHRSYRVGSRARACGI